VKTLREYLTDFVDWDGASFYLGVTLGLWSEDSFMKNKGVFWSNNPVGKMLHELLQALVETNVLERIEEPDTRYRWKGVVDVSRIGVE
jgi:hypothetical protein